MPFTRSQRRAGHAHFRYLVDKIYDKYRHKERYKQYLEYKQSLQVDDLPQLNANMENLSTGVSRSKLKISVNPPLKGMLKGSIEYRDYYNYELGWDAGVKHFVNVCNLGTRGQWFTQNFFANMCNESSQNWFSLSPNQGQVGGSFVPAVPQPFAQKMGVSTANIKMDLINLSTLPCRVKISWWRCMKNTESSLLTDYNTQVPQQELFTTDFATATGVVTEPTQGGNETVLTYFLGSSTIPNNITTMPYINLESRKTNLDNYRKLKSQTITMAAGDIHTVDNYLALNIFQSRQHIADVDEAFYLSGGVQCIIEMQGLATHLVVPASEGQPAVNEITCSAGRLGVMISRHLNLKSLKTVEDRYDVTYIGRGHNVVGGKVENSKTVQENTLAYVSALQTT